MKPLYSINPGDYLVGSYIEKNYQKQKWNVWFPSKDTGIDLLVSDSRNRKTVSLQVKFSKDFTPTHGTPVEMDHLLASGWWTPVPGKIEGSAADFWIVVLLSFIEKEQTSFIILPPTELFRRFKAIPGIYNKNSKRIQSYLHVTKAKKNEKKQCWEARGLSNAAKDSVALGEFDKSPEFNKERDFTEFLNAWKQIETRLN